MDKPPIPFEEFLSSSRARVDEALALWLPEDPGVPAVLREALSYSVLAGGKRIRPILVLMVGESLGTTGEGLMRAACAFELLHTYSLIHDDLPAMDNDDLRRGRPTSHVRFGEATAILAGDALLTMSFEWMALSERFGLLEERALEAMLVLARAAGPAGMVGGQILDMAAENRAVTIDELRRIHGGKTGALLAAAVEVGGILGGASGRERDLLRIFGEHLGLLFQIVDDILDVVGESAQLGKTSGSDVRLGKATYPAVLGLPEARRLAAQAKADALKVWGQFPRKIPRLGELAEHIHSRAG